MRRFLVGLLIIAVLITAVVYRRTAKSEPAGTTVAIILSLTGPAARFDAIKQQAVELAVARVKEQDPSLVLDVQVLDAGASPDVAQAAARAALGRRASYILTGTSPNALAVATLARPQLPSVVQIANAANPNFGPPRRGEYRFWPDWNDEARLVVELLRREGLDSVLVLHSADPYSESLTASFARGSEEPPRIDVTRQQYDPATTPDFRPLLLRAKSQGVKALVIFGLPPGINALFGQLGDIGWDRPVVGGVNTNLASEQYEKAGLAGPLWTVRTESMAETLPPDSEASLFRARFIAKTGQAPPFHALYLADAIYFIAAASRLVTEGDSTVSRAEKVTGFIGPSGSIRIANGVLAFPMRVERIR